MTGHRDLAGAIWRVIEIDPLASAMWAAEKDEARSFYPTIEQEAALIRAALREHGYVIVLQLPPDTVCACLDETGERKVAGWQECQRCHAQMEPPPALTVERLAAALLKADTNWPYLPSEVEQDAAAILAALGEAT